MKEYSDYKLLFYTESILMSCEAEDVKKQKLEKFGKTKLDNLIKKGLTFDDEFDMRRYAIYKSRNEKHLVLVTTGCYKEDYDLDNNCLPTIDEVMDCCSIDCKDPDEYFPVDVYGPGITFAYKWHNNVAEYMTLSSEDVYNELIDSNYHGIISYVENRLPEECYANREL